MGVDIGLVTCQRLAELDEDGQMLLPALRQAGWSASPVVWNDPQVDWRQFRLCIVRSTWDYELQRGAYLAWAERAARQTLLWNPPEVLRWNTDKRYLLELWRRGVPIVPTVVIETGAEIPYGYLREIWQQQRLIVKPAVAAGARRMQVVDDDCGPRMAAHVTLVQPYLDTVSTHGEMSLIFFGSEFSHAVHKMAKAGEYRVQEEWGGTYRRVTPSDTLMAAAARVFQAVGKPLLYARLDFMQSPAGNYLLGEAELTEPSLYHRVRPESATHLAEHVARLLAERPVGSNL